MKRRLWLGALDLLLWIDLMSQENPILLSSALVGTLLLSAVLVVGFTEALVEEDHLLA